MTAYATPNKNGVYVPKECEVIRSDASNWKIEIFIAHPSESEWIADTGIWTGHEGASGWPSIHQKTFPTRLAALHHEIDMTVKYLDGIFNRHSQVTDPECIRIIQMKKWLQEQKVSALQLALF